MFQAGARESIPPLCSPEKDWKKDPESKAELLAHVWREKATLDDATHNEYSKIRTPANVEGGFTEQDQSEYVDSQTPVSPCRFPVRTRKVRNVLQQLDTTSATGPDLISSLVLQSCAEELAFPIATIARIIIREGVWPDAWRLHWLIPLFKRKARSDPANYRGIHLTSQLSKVVERILGSLIFPSLEDAGAYGENQFAYRKGKGYRDVLAWNTLTWLLALESNQVIAVYCSDVSGAFDRVPRSRLLSKLEAFSLHPNLMRIVASWLDQRTAQVAVHGCFSNPYPLENSVFQGTVWGPKLWNCFYSDSRTAVRKHGFIESIFADDLNAFKAFPSYMSNCDVRMEIERVQTSLHAWGAANQARFDQGKEKFAMLHRGHGEGEPFTILSALYDTKLRMHLAINKAAAEAGWRVKAILRVRKFFTRRQLIRHYKSQVLSFIESSSVAFSHAADSVICKLDNIQVRFLKALGLTEEDGIRDYNLAPLHVRRCISTLGMLHKLSLGTGSCHIAELFPQEPKRVCGFSTRQLVARHDKQILDRVGGSSTDAFRRSAFGLVRVFNFLPAKIVDIVNTSLFQSKLQKAVTRYSYLTTTRQWQFLLSDACDRMSIKAFQSYFDGI